MINTQMVTAGISDLHAVWLLLLAVGIVEAVVMLRREKEGE